MIQLAAFINLFFAPMLSIYLYYRRQKRQLRPTLDLLFQYGIAASCNYALARLILMVPQKLLGSSHSVDSAHYTLAALLAAWLLPQLYKVAGNIRVELDFARRDGSGKKAAQNDSADEEPRHEEADKR